MVADCSGSKVSSVNRRSKLKMEEKQGSQNRPQPTFALFVMSSQLRTVIVEIVQHVQSLKVLTTPNLFSRLESQCVSLLCLFVALATPKAKLWCIANDLPNGPKTKGNSVQWNLGTLTFRNIYCKYCEFLKEYTVVFLKVWGKSVYFPEVPWVYISWRAKGPEGNILSRDWRKIYFLPQNWRKTKYIPEQVCLVSVEAECCNHLSCRGVV